MIHPPPGGPDREAPQPGPAAVAVTGSAVLSGGIWSVATRILPQLYTVVASLVAARFLGPADMGRQSFIAFVELSAVMIFTGGLPIALTRFISETLGQGRAGAVRPLVSWVWRIEGAAAVLGVTTLAVVGLEKGALRPAWFLAAAACGLVILHSVPSAVLNGTHRWRQATIAGTVTSFLGLLGVVLALVLGAGIVGIFAVEAATALANLLWSVALARRAVRTVAPVPVPAPEVRRAMNRFGALSSLVVFLNFLVWRRSDFFFLDRYSSDEQIAFYSIGFGAVTVLLVGAQAVGHVFAPAVAHLVGAAAEGRVTSGFARTMRLLLQVALPLTAAGLALGPAGIVTAYGEEYRPATQVLLLLLAPLPISALVTVAAAMLDGLGRVWVALCAMAGGAAVNITLDLLLVPAHGAAGAAVASGTAQVVVGVGILAGACRAVGPVRWHVDAMLRAIVVSVLAGVAARAGVALFTDLVGLLAGTVSGLVTYVLLAGVVKPFAAPDAAWLSREVGSRLGRRAGRTVAGWGRPS